MLVDSGLAACLEEEAAISWSGPWKKKNAPPPPRENAEPFITDDETPPKKRRRDPAEKARAKSKIAADEEHMTRWREETESDEPRETDEQEGYPFGDDA